MDGTPVVSWIGSSIKISTLDLLLSGDNALMIALACRILPVREVPRAIFFGTASAVVFRVLLTTIAGWLVTLPYLELTGALILLLVAVSLTAGEGDDQLLPGAPSEDAEETRGRISTAIMTIVLADAIMSLDNIVALAAVSKGNFWLLSSGLALSIPLLVYGGAMLAGLLKSYPALITLGGAVLGWTAGDLAVADPAIAAWVSEQAPALLYVLPMAGALYVLMQQPAATRVPVPAMAQVPQTQKRRPRPAPNPARSATLSPASAAAQHSASKVSDRVPARINTPAINSLSASPQNNRKREERLVLLGLVGLFLITGIFISVAVYLSESSSFGGG